MDDAPPMGIAATLRSFSKEYGPYAFGVLSLLLVWYAIVAPTLAANRIDTAALKAISDTLSRTASTNESTAQSLAATASRMERIADKINSGR